MIGLFLTAILFYAQTDGVTKRGDHAMGFSHDKTTHHFRLAPDGGAIEVTSNDAADTSSRDEIRNHLTHIATMFAAGDFDLPMFIHDKVPPGVPVMKRLRAQIDYKFEAIDNGARVKIVTANPEGLKAVHAFLRFQIKDHHTGDPL